MALLAKSADGTFLDDWVPEIKEGSVKWLLDTIASSMLVISIFAVTSMLSAFAAAQTTATPRSFKLVVADDVSQNALSVFISAFIFGIVASVAINDNYFGRSGRFVLFVFALAFFALIILVFLRWVDRISRLGRLEHTISQIEDVTTEGIIKRLENPRLRALPIDESKPNGTAIFSKEAGYVQNINLSRLQSYAEKVDLRIRVNALPGKAVNPGVVLAYIQVKDPIGKKEVTDSIHKSFIIGRTRDFEADPRFGLIALSEISSRALSPGINDPGTAIQIISSLERLFFLWDQHHEDKEEELRYNRIEMPVLKVDDLFLDSFRATARDGAGNIEVMLRMQKAFNALFIMKNKDVREAALVHSELAFKRAEQSMTLEQDLEALRKSCLYLNQRT
jgi:uncharacterized membrane protein